MKITILTLFKEEFYGIINSSIIKRAIENKVCEINIIDYREFSKKRNKRVDDYSYGGGAGMIIEAQPIVDALKSIPNFETIKKIITSPIGKTYNQKKAIELSKENELIIVCGHYEGIDHRIMDYVDEAISIGDYILTGGEIAAMAIIDSIIRLLPEALGNEESKVDESFENNLLEYPQYTRPEVYDGKKVPNVLISGNHENIRKWRRFMALKTTYENRPDLIDKAKLSSEDEEFLVMIKEGKDINFN